MDSKFWNDVYQSKSELEVSWFQALPEKSLELIEEMKLGHDTSIIDVGGGDSRLVDHLLLKGYRDISVLDISKAALEKARLRLGERSQSVTLIESDVTKFEPKREFGLWHDRATFHFLTKAEDILRYLEVASRAISPNGYLIVSTFSKSGPDKCSGLPISNYDETDLKTLFEVYFENIRCFESTHTTPWGSTQNFVYCGFKKRP